MARGKLYHVGFGWDYSSNGLSFRLQPYRSEHYEDKIVVTGGTSNARGLSGRQKEILKDLKRKQ